MIKRKKIRYLRGFWYNFTRDDAQRGAVLKTINQYLEDKEDGHKFYGISVYDHAETFKYFLGSRDEIHHNLILEAKEFYEVAPVKDAYTAYDDFLKSKLKVAPLFGGDVQYNEIPTKIEKYRKNNDEITLLKIQIPISK